MGIKDHFSVVIRDYPYSIDEDELGLTGGSQSLMHVRGPQTISGEQFHG